MNKKLNSEMSAGTAADKSGADEVTTSSHSSANTTVVCCLSLDEIKTGNKLIADFMGVEIGVDNFSWRIGCIEPLQEKHLNYHDAWGWLMPIIEKIEKLGHSVHIVGDTFENNGVWNYTNIYDKEGDELINGFHERSKMLTTYKSVIAFIEWYNSVNDVSKR